MNFKIILPEWIRPEHFKDALVIGFVLCVSSYGVDVLLFWLQIPAAATVFNDLAVGVLGAGLSLFYLSSVRVNQIYLRAKDRMTLMAELNHHVGKSLTSIRNAASLRDEGDRVRQIDEAADHINRVLLELVPTPGKEDAPRYFLAEEK